MSSIYSWFPERLGDSAGFGKNRERERNALVQRRMIELSAFWLKVLSVNNRAV